MLNRSVDTHPFIWTSGEKQWMVDNLTPDMITDSDIIYGLAKECRFARQIRYDLFYSVAQHSLYLRSFLTEPYGIYALLHDAAEAYLGDMAKPIKVLLPDYNDLEDKVMQVIAEKYDLDWPFPKIVHEADRRILLDEVTQLFDKHPSWVQDHLDAGIEPLGITIESWDWQHAAVLFERALNIELMRHRKLRSKVKRTFVAPVRQPAQGLLKDNSIHHINDW
jgi:hypothetical protein